MYWSSFSFPYTFSYITEYEMPSWPAGELTNSQQLKLTVAWWATELFSHRKSDHFHFCVQVPTERPVLLNNHWTLEPWLKGLFKRTQQCWPNIIWQTWNAWFNCLFFKCFDNPIRFIPVETWCVKYLQKKQHKTLFENCCMMLGEHCWVRLNRTLANWKSLGGEFII